MQVHFLNSYENKYDQNVIDKIVYSRGGFKGVVDGAAAFLSSKCLGN